MGTQVISHPPVAHHTTPRQRTATSTSRLRLVTGALVGLLVMTATTSVSWADDASPSPREATLSYGPEPYQVLDLQRPDPYVFPGPRAVLIYLHAGGWIAGDRTGIPDMVSAQVARGYVLASIDYRLATVGPDGQPAASFPDAIWDVKRAIRSVKAKATTWGIDPDRVILVGASAGGHLAAFVGATRGLFEPPEMPRLPGRATGLVGAGCGGSRRPNGSDDLRAHGPSVGGSDDGRVPRLREAVGEQPADVP